MIFLWRVSPSFWIFGAIDKLLFFWRGLPLIRAFGALKKSVVFLEGFALNRNFWSSEKEGACFLEGFALAWSFSCSWTCPNSDFSCNFQRFGLRNDFWFNFRMILHGFASRSLKTYFFHSKTFYSHTKRTWTRKNPKNT